MGPTPNTTVFLRARRGRLNTQEKNLVEMEAEIGHLDFEVLYSRTVRGLISNG